MMSDFHRATLGGLAFVGIASVAFAFALILLG
jgi:hypothetical protein